MLNLSFAGTLGRDPETRAAGESEVTEFSVAVSGYDRKARAKTTTWLKVNIWGKRGPQIAGLTAKGSKVAGCGSFETQTYTNRDGVEKTTFVVTCQDLTLQSFADKDEASEPRPGRAAQNKASKASGGKSAPAEEFPDDDLPF